MGRPTNKLLLLGLALITLVPITLMPANAGPDDIHTCAEARTWIDEQLVQAKSLGDEIERQNDLIDTLERKMDDLKNVIDGGSADDDIVNDYNSLVLRHREVAARGRETAKQQRKIIAAGNPVIEQYNAQCVNKGNPK